MSLPTDFNLRAAAQALIEAAEPDDNWEGEYIAFLVPFEHIDKLRAILAATEAPRGPISCSCDWPGCQGQCHTGDSCPCHPTEDRDEQIERIAAVNGKPDAVADVWKNAANHARRATPRPR